MSKENQLLIWQCVSLLFFVAIAFLLFDGRCRSNPPDPRGHLVYMIPIQKGTQVMRDGRVRRMMEFGRRDASYALGLEGDVWVKVEKEK